jgi:tetratricopeptide (TPR) repeat protein
LVGLGSWGDSGFTVEQYFMRDFHEERALLLELRERLDRVQVLVTFNGKSFDLPLLESRFVLARLSWPLSQVPHLDLLHPARRLWKLRLGDCSLANLEKRILAMERETDVPGYLIPQLYFNYTRTKNPKGLKEIFEHNRQDIETLAALTALVGETFLGVHAHNDLGGEELLSLGKYFQVLGQRQLSLELSQAALQRDLSESLKVRVMLQLAGLFKSQQRYSQAVDLWKAMIASSPAFVPEAWENLAVYYEHRERNLPKALELTEQALRMAGIEEARSRAASLEGWHRRHDRLLRKMEKQASP